MKKYLRLSLAALLIITLYNLANAQDFEDVHTLHINKDAVEYLQESKVVEGYEDGTYKPENRINRAEFVKIIVASQEDEPTGSDCFKDVKNEWYAKYICSAKKKGIISGHPDGTFKPGEYINFAEASKIISEALDVEEDTSGTQGEWFAGYVNGIAKRKAIPSTVDFFDKDISRGEMAEVIWRLKEEKTDKVSQDYESITQEFPAIKSCSALKEKFDAYQSFDYGYPIALRGDVVFEAMDFATDEAATGAPAPAAALKSGSAAESVVADDFSSTNIQVQGVDEADIIKNDGKYIYLIKGDTVRIIEAFPPSIMKEVAEVSFDDDDFTPREMYVNDKQLIVVGNSYPNYGGIIRPLIYPPRPWRGNETKVYILDISDIESPEEERRVSFDGDYNTSRRIGDNLYMVMNAHPNVWIMDEITKGEDLLPKFKDGDADEKALVGCGDIHYFPGVVRPNYLIVTSIPLNDSKGEIDREVFLGSSDNVYSSKTDLFVATNDVSYNYYTDWDWQRDRSHTLIYKFGLKDGNVEYESRGRVPGRILNQFSMDQHKDHFRIATTIDSWITDEPSSNNVYVLDPDMKRVGAIEDIAPGERIFSTRFLGDRLYMVTFERIDPLFVIDMSSPSNPKILGKLKIPGFSDYLHPFDDKHIIGFGKETKENKWGGITTAGFKMALFDVSDVAKPKQKFVEHIGDQGTDSELLRNHKALLFDKEKELLAFPIRINELVSADKLECNKYRYSTCPNLCQKRCIPSTCSEDKDGNAICTDDCEGLGSCTTNDYERYTTTFSGAVVYNLNASTGFKERGRVTHYDEVDLLKMGNYWPYDYKLNIQRIIYIGDYLYSISQNKVKSSTMDDVEDVSAIDLE